MTAAIRWGEPHPAWDTLQHGREIIQSEARALHALAERLGDEFLQAVDLIVACKGSVIVSGIGKAGLIGRKLAATLASTGTRSHFLHPAEAIHGDLGMVGPDDLMLILSQSGETEEITRLLPTLRGWGTPLLALTGNPRSTLGRAATVVAPLGEIREACTLGLAPSASTAAMLAMGDALALVVSRLRRFSEEDFARFHPGGSLGRKLAKVEEVMRPLRDCRLANERRTVRETLVRQSRPGRRSGAVMVVDGSGALTGIFTDSDLARLLEAKRDGAIDGPLSEVMTRAPRTVQLGARASEAVALLAERKISELPVVDGLNRPAGMIDITDVVGLAPPVVVPPRPRLAVVAEESPADSQLAGPQAKAQLAQAEQPARPEQRVETFWD